MEDKIVNVKDLFTYIGELQYRIRLLEKEIYLLKEEKNKLNEKIRDK